MTVLVVWCLLSIPVGVVLGLCIREGKGAGPRVTDGPQDAAELVSGSASVSSEHDATVAAGVGLPAQRRPVARQGQLHDA